MTTFKEFSARAAELAVEVAKEHIGASPEIQNRVELAVDHLLKAKAQLARARVLAGEPEEKFTGVA